MIPYPWLSPIQKACYDINFSVNVILMAVWSEIMVAFPGDAGSKALQSGFISWWFRSSSSQGLSSYFLFFSAYKRISWGTILQPNTNNTLIKQDCVFVLLAVCKDYLYITFCGIRPLVILICTLYHFFKSGFSLCSDNTWEMLPSGKKFLQL